MALSLWLVCWLKQTYVCVYERQKQYALVCVYVVRVAGVGVYIHTYILLHSMYVYIYIYIYVYTYEYMCIHIPTYTHIHIYIHTHIHIYTYTHKHTHAHMLKYTSPILCNRPRCHEFFPLLFTCTYVYVHMCMQAHMQICMNISVHRFIQAVFSTSVSMRVCVCINMDVRAYARRYVSIYAYIDSNMQYFLLLFKCTYVFIQT